MIKLVYDNWENDTPIPNGVKNKIGINPNTFSIPYEIINIFKKIENIKLKDIDKNSLYIINHQCEYLDMINSHNHNNWILSEEVEENIKNKNLKIIFLNLHESFDQIEIQLKEFEKFIVGRQLPEKNFYILNNNSSLYEIKTNMNVFKTNWLIEYMNTTNLKDLKFITNKKFIFLLHNRVPKMHRISLLILLKKFDLLKENIIDWSLTHTASENLDSLNFGQNMIKTGFNYNKRPYSIFVDINSKKIRPLFKEMITTKKLSYYEQSENWFDGTLAMTHDSANYNKSNSFEQSYINIVAESHYSETDIHISEKTYRPFYCFQIPIFLASYKHISKLRKEHPELYLFDDLIDHSYDNEIDNTKRLVMIVNEIKRLSEMRDTIETYYIKNETKFIENRKYIESYSNNNSTLNYFKSLVKNDTI